MILEVERFYEIEVNGVRWSIGWNSCSPVNRRRRPLRRVQGGLTVGDVEPEAVSGCREAGQKSADRPVIAPDARVDVASIRAAIPYLSRMTSKIEGSDRNRLGTESARPGPLSASAAGHGIGRGKPLKVETRVQSRWDYQGKPEVTKNARASGKHALRLSGSRLGRRTGATRVRMTPATGRAHMHGRPAADGPRRDAVHHITCR